MPSNDLYLKCRAKADELLEKYFPNFSHEAGVLRPEELAPEYNEALPAKIQAEFRDWLGQLWKEVAPSDAKPFDEAMNLDDRLKKMEEANAGDLERARAEAERRSLWERITRTNHQQVTYYKGLLKQYTEETLAVMINDFLAEFYPPIA